MSVCNSERIVKIGQYLPKLWSNEEGTVFLTHSVDVEAHNNSENLRENLKLDLKQKLETAEKLQRTWSGPAEQQTVYDALQAWVRRLADAPVASYVSSEHSSAQYDRPRQTLPTAAHQNHFNG